MLFVCISDKKYFPYACAFMASARRSNPEYNIAYHLINGTSEQIEAVAMHENISLSTESIDFESTEHLKRYIINVRFDMILRLFAEGHNEVCYVDVDMVVRKSLAPILKQCQGHDLGIWMRHDLDWPKKESIFNAAFIWAANTPASVDFFQKVSKRSVELMSQYDWFTDQIALYEIYVENPGAVKIAPLPRNINDDQLKWRSSIWAGKWSCDQVQKTYAVEEAYHQALFKGESPAGGRIRVEIILFLLKVTYPLSRSFWGKFIRGIRCSDS